MLESKLRKGTGNLPGRRPLRLPGARAAASLPTRGSGLSRPPVPPAVPSAAAPGAAAVRPVPPPPRRLPGEGGEGAEKRKDVYSGA